MRRHRSVVHEVPFQSANLALFLLTSLIICRAADGFFIGDQLRLSLSGVIPNRSLMMRTIDPSLQQRSPHATHSHLSSSSSNNNNEPTDTTTTNNPQQSSFRILLVDDEPAILHAVSQLLQDAGYDHVTTCQDGSTALQWALSEPRPHIVVSDVRMPDMDGLDLLRAIRSSPTIQSLPVVLLTAKSLPKDRVAGYTAGADAYLPKPFDPAELLAIVENVLQRNYRHAAEETTIRDLHRDLEEIKSKLLVTTGRVEKPVFLAPDERGILELVCEGLTNKEIAKRSFLSSRRVEQVLTILFQKAGVKNRTELVRWAVAKGQVKL